MVTPPPRRPLFSFIRTRINVCHEISLATRNERTSLTGGVRGQRPAVGGTGLLEGEGTRVARVATAMVLVRAEELAQPTDSKEGRRASLVTD